MAFRRCPQGVLLLQDPAGYLPLWVYLLCDDSMLAERPWWLRLTGTPTRMQRQASEPTGLGGQVWVPAGWFADPRQRHQLRWWDGSKLSSRVLDDTVELVDLPSGPGRFSRSQGIASIPRRGWHA
jgi:hypothetical protein